MKLFVNFFNCLKETRNPYFCVAPKIRRFTNLYHFCSKTQKILTKDIFNWLELITEILSFLQIFSARKTTTQLFNISETLQKYQQKNDISGKFWAFKSKSQKIDAATYIAMFLRDSNNFFSYV